MQPQGFQLSNYWADVEAKMKSDNDTVYRSIAGALSDFHKGLRSPEEAFGSAFRMYSYPEQVRVYKDIKIKHVDKFWS